MPDWQEILSRHGPAAWRTAYRLLGNRADADECLQEACLAAFEVSRRETVHNWQGLIQRLAVARSVDRLRSRKRTKLEPSAPQLLEVRDGYPLPPQAVEDAELADQLRQVLGQIPAKQAEAFCLHHIDDWSYQQIALFLKISVNSVGVLIHRARRRLRHLLVGSDPVRVRINLAPTISATNLVRPESPPEESL